MEKEKKTDKKQRETCESFCIRPNFIQQAQKKIPPFQTIIRTAEIFQALSDPTRIRLLSALAKSELCVCELSEVLKMTISAISHQLRFLRTLRLVKARKEGRVVYYSVDDKHVDQLLRMGIRHSEHD